MTQEVKHTPGPWMVEPGNGGAIYPGIEAPEFSVVVFGDDNDDGGVRGRNPVETLANAHLIAAAPELLEDGSIAADMLDMFLRCWAENKEISDEEGRRATAALMKLHLTLAKARGESA